MRIERHTIGEATVSAVLDDFTNRIGREVHSMSKAGPVGTYEWGMIAEEFVGYLCAQSARDPALRSPEAKAVLLDAAEAAAGKVCYAAYYPFESFQVHLNYVNWGLIYEREAGGKRVSISASDWIESFCLNVLAGRAERHGEAFHFAREAPQEGAAGQPAVELINGLMAYVLGDTGDEMQSSSPSRQERLAAIEAALGRISEQERAGGEGLTQRPQSVALRALRALAAGEQAVFAEELGVLVTAHHDAAVRGERLEGLLPLLPLTLAALAYRREGWPVPVETDYLPHALVSGFETPGPRVGPYGRDRRADAAAQLAAGSVSLDRPGDRHPIHPDTLAHLKEETAQALALSQDEPVSATTWAEAMRDQVLYFQWRVGADGETTDEQLAHLSLASRCGAAAFRTARSDGTYDSYYLSAFNWLTAVNLALITGVRKDLAALVTIEPERLSDGSAYQAHYQAVHDYLRGVDPELATDRALADLEKIERWGFFPPPTTLLSQLVEGDEESFNLALLDALEAHRDYYLVADRATDPNAAVSLPILALACHARRRGWNIRVRSPYLPARILNAAKPL
uniref:immunity 49 family protein n=1 Tax=Streptomyces polyasparticus TaxID=2767826 RepID=UPI00280C06F3|nr:Imm49 family immunity protein [Streptomyces polyasparticus]